MFDAMVRRWPLKLLSLVLALAVWIAVTGESRVVQDFRVPVDFQLGAPFILEGAIPTTIGVRLRGPETTLRRLAPFNLALRVDLRGADVGERSVQLAESQLDGVPPGVDVEFIDPGRLSLTVTRRSRRTVPVAPAFVGKPAAGRAFYWAQAKPETVEIEGPAAKVDAVAHVRTDPIHLDGRSLPFTVRVGAVPDAADVRVVNARPIEVLAHVDVAPVEASFDDVPVLLAGKVWEAVVSPATVRITLAGPAPLLQAIRPTQLRAVADLEGLSPRTEAHQVPLRLDFVGVPLEDLARITVRQMAPSRVRVRLQDKRIPS
ncbi:MAG TPA: CdaR family protein [Candidatus Polarisedimenticolaceae bacterium]